MRAYERLLKYVQVWTTSDEASDQVPSTERQFDLARLLESEMKELGLKEVHVDEHCYVYGTIPASPGYEQAPAIVLIAHLDTAPDYSGEHVRPQVWENYDGGDLTLPSGRVLSTQQLPHLPSLKGRTLITSDGSTLLGADDKAGIAEIMTMAERLIGQGAGEDDWQSGHGRVCVAFTPDEEIGGGAALLDIPALGAAWGYTVDGGPEGEVTYENFNAARADIEIQGVSIHPGDAKDVMVNASLVACRFNELLPGTQTPAHTSGREGFYHLTRMEGDTDHASLHYIIRDHDEAIYQARLETLRHITQTLNEQYGSGTVTLTVTEQYRNMIEKIRPCMYVVDYAVEATKEAGLEPCFEPVRGGTDGAQLSFRGLPCPNLGTGGYAFHGPSEHITAEGMDYVVEILMGIVRHAARHRG